APACFAFLEWISMQYGHCVVSAAAFKRRTREHRRDLARAAGADAAAAETFADCFTALIEGALILRQTHGRNDAARVVRPAVEQLIAAYLRPCPKQPA
ncbi:MAG: hypothetical protein ABIP55_04240, partial [Tepidisphaeraceae bacterium]